MKKNMCTMDHLLALSSITSYPKNMEKHIVLRIISCLLLNKRRQDFSYDFSFLHLIIYPMWHPYNRTIVHALIPLRLVIVGSNLD